MSINGILLINKPQAWTSHDVCNFVRRRFKIQKVGHTGTLDPQATGVLVLLLGTFTKFSSQFTKSDKEYAGTIELGITTTTQDGEGDIIEQREVGDLSPDDIKRTFETFRGPQEQVPPMVSAIRSGGVRLYELARKGKEVERKPRHIEVFELECQKIQIPYIDFRVVCSKGTYVRTLAHDIGQQLGCGAYLKSLCRTRNGVYHISECVAIDDLKALAEQNDIKKYVKPNFCTQK